MVMQPPVNSAHLRDYIERLKLEARVASSRPLEKSIKSADPIEAYTYQITSWINALPESQQKQPYRIDSIIRLAGLKGVYAESPSPQQVALALRKAGWLMKRSYKKADRNARVWLWHSNDTPLNILPKK